MVRFPVLVALTTMACLTVPAPPAGAAKGPPKAVRKLLRAGNKALRKKRFDEALAQAEAAREASDHPKVLLLLGQALAALERCAEALPHLEALDGQLKRRDEKKRAAADAGCRVNAATARLAAGECEVAAATLAKLGPAATAPEALTRRVALCRDAFGAGGDDAASAWGAGLADLDAERWDEARRAGARSIDARDTPAGRYLRGRALAGLGRCGEAVADLAKAERGLPAGSPTRDDAARTHTRCLEQLVGDGEGGADCAEALPHLVALAGRLDGDAEAARAARVASCADSAPFPVDSDGARAAWDRHLGARAALAADDRKRARELSEAALALHEHPFLRRAAARARLAAGSCAGAAELLAALPDTERTPGDAITEKVCTEWPPDGDVPGDALEQYVAHAVQALSARDTGRPGLAAVAAAEALKAAPSRALRALRADALFDEGDCPGYAEEAAAADPGRLVDPEARAQRCGSDPVGPISGGGSHWLDDPFAPASPVWAWTAIGGGAALIGGAVPLFLRSDQRAGRADNAEANLAGYRDGGGTASQIAHAEAAAEDARSGATVDLAIGISMAVVGAAAAGFGTWLLLEEPFATGPDAEASTHLVVGPGIVAVEVTFR